MNVTALEADLKIAEKRRGDTVVRAPFDGVVGEKLISSGQFVKDNIGILKLVQLARMRAAEEQLEELAKKSGNAYDLLAAARATPLAVGVRVIEELRIRRSTGLERLRAVADRAIVTERKQARTLLSPLGSIAAST